MNMQYWSILLYNLPESLLGVSGLFNGSSLSEPDAVKSSIIGFTSMS